MVFRLQYSLCSYWGYVTGMGISITRYSIQSRVYGLIFLSVAEILGDFNHMFAYIVYHLISYPIRLEH